MISRERTQGTHRHHFGPFPTSKYRAVGTYTGGSSGSQGKTRFKERYSKRPPRPGSCRSLTIQGLPSEGVM